MARLKGIVLGGARDFRDPAIFHKLSLIAFIAWVGLGADGLSSANYGPEESFLALGQHGFLGIFVALATALTIFVIASSYSQIVELFPSGGGGYLVASKLLSPTLGMISGCALLIDYVLTITLSIASGADAIFSFLPLRMLPWRSCRGFRRARPDAPEPAGRAGIGCCCCVPVFLLFLVTHTFAVLYAFGTHVPKSGDRCAPDGRSNACAVHRPQLGTFGVVPPAPARLQHGRGHLYGNRGGEQRPADPARAAGADGQAHHALMAVSLAVMVAGLMSGYLLFKVTHVPGQDPERGAHGEHCRGLGRPGGSCSSSSR